MCVPVMISEMSMVCDAGSLARPTRLSKDHSSRDGKIPPPKNGVREIASRPTTAAGSSGSRGGGRVVGLLALAFALVIKLGNVERKMLVELPSGFRCIWNDLPHIIQFVAISMMLVLLYGVNRVFDKADEAMSTRLSCATAAFLHERRHHPAPRPLVLLATSDKVASAAARDAAFLHQRGHHAKRLGSREGTPALPPRAL
ncbi:unnamed protein product [Ectocarpus sp. 12 AP-2014]